MMPRQPSPLGAPAVTEDTPCYVISAPAELSGLHPQTLRQYDRLGLVSPDRAPGRGRRYSVRDIELLREVQRLSQDEGVNLAGIKRIRELQDQVEELSAQVSVLEQQLAAALATSIPVAVPNQAAPNQNGQAAQQPVAQPMPNPLRRAELLPALPAFGHSTALVVWKPQSR
jgi:MerR family transcriptional regulator, heat shock protein HspR